MFRDAGCFPNLDTGLVKLYLTDGSATDPYGNKTDETKKVGYMPGSENESFFLIIPPSALNALNATRAVIDRMTSRENCFLLFCPTWRAVLKMFPR